jgi:hypothetical protein
VDRVERFAREVQEFLFWRIGGLREWIHPKVFLTCFTVGLRSPFDQEGGETSQLP